MTTKMCISICEVNSGEMPESDPKSELRGRARIHRTLVDPNPGASQRGRRREPPPAECPKAFVGCHNSELGPLAAFQI
jgi:hypothetical protein